MNDFRSVPRLQKFLLNRSFVSPSAPKLGIRATQQACENAIQKIAILPIAGSIALNMRILPLLPSHGIAISAQQISRLDLFRAYRSGLAASFDNLAALAIKPGRS